MDEIRFDMVRNSCRGYAAKWASESINLDSYRNMFKSFSNSGVDDKFAKK